MFTKAEVDIFTSIFARLLPDAASSVLKLSYTQEERERMHLLSAKAGQGVISKAENEELEGYATIGRLLTIMQSKARQSFEKTSPQR